MYRIFTTAIITLFLLAFSASSYAKWVWRCPSPTSVYKIMNVDNSYKLSHNGGYTNLLKERKPIIGGWTFYVRRYPQGALTNQQLFKKVNQDLMNLVFLTKLYWEAKALDDIICVYKMPDHHNVEVDLVNFNAYPLFP